MHNEAIRDPSSWTRGYLCIVLEQAWWKFGASRDAERRIRLLVQFSYFESRRQLAFLRCHRPFRSLCHCTDMLTLEIVFTAVDDSCIQLKTKPICWARGWSGSRTSSADRLCFQLNAAVVICSENSSQCQHTSTVTKGFPNPNIASYFAVVPKTESFQEQVFATILSLQVLCSSCNCKLAKTVFSITSH